MDGSADWMMSVPDDRPISMISIPGSHNSGADCSQLAYFTKCQSADIYTQLEMGVRYLDIRLGILEGELTLWHSFCRCQVSAWPLSAALTMESVIDDCRMFLSRHPSETVILVCKSERDDDISEIQEMLDSLIGDDQLWILSGSVPTMGECRGKIVLMRRWQDDAGLEDRAGIEVGWNDQGNRGETYLMSEYEYSGDIGVYIQDRYKYEADDKWDAVLDSLSCSPDDETLNICFLSTNGDNDYGHPYKYAQILNRRFMEEEIRTDGAWVIADFVTPALCEKIYSLNR
ncbi:MAG: phosphatidylinositol-specific phospholipase C domain-containing protein [Clostridiales bacterium]|nr:phosphatidylinositol-specific phospholipase C domain-containing protein [Clostridiales bacterium]